MNIADKIDKYLGEGGTVKCPNCKKKTAYGECEFCGKYNHPLDPKGRKTKKPKWMSLK